MKKLALFVVLGGLMLGLVGCGNKDEASGAETLTVAYQYGMSYAPLMIMQEQGLIEQKYEGEINVEWINLNSGSAINEGFASGDIDVAGMGVAPYITGESKGIPYKMYGTISAQPHKLMTNKSEIQSIQDITSENKISLVNIGSIQHILLAMLAKEELGDAHALDKNIVAMSHPDGMAALLAGSVDCQLTTSPYIYQEKEAGTVTEVAGLEKVWPDGNAFIVGLISEECETENPELYAAIMDATKEAMTFINENPKEAAVILAEKMDVTAEQVEEWLSDPACVYDMELPGVTDMADFMEKEGFLE